MQDSGCKMQDARCSMLDAGLVTLSYCEGMSLCLTRGISLYLLRSFVNDCKGVPKATICLIEQVSRSENRILRFALDDHGSIFPNL